MMNNTLKGRCATKVYVSACFICSVLYVSAQKTFPLNDLSSFEPGGAAWQVVKDVYTNENIYGEAKLVPGTGVLVYAGQQNGNGEMLITKDEYGNYEMTLDFMTSKGSSAAIWICREYRLLLTDSWGSGNRTAAVSGTVMPKRHSTGMPLYPRQNVCRAPGLWQHLTVSFNAAKYSNGQKTAHAKINKILLNHFLILENIELPSAGGETQPIGFEGGSSTSAFANISVQPFSEKSFQMQDLTMSYYKGSYEFKDITPAAKPALSMSTPYLTASNIPGLPENDFLLQFTGNIRIEEPGEYRFDLFNAGGSGSLIIDNKPIIPRKEVQGTGSTYLDTGTHAFEIIYKRYILYESTAFRFSVTTPSGRRLPLSENIMLAEENESPIYVDASDENVIRSFVHSADGRRVPHAINVGSEEGVHFTFDAATGSMFQVWKGNFLDASGMWVGLGDCSTAPAGSVLFLENPAPFMLPEDSAGNSWKTDTSDLSIIFRGYRFVSNRNLIFSYQYRGAWVEDSIAALADGAGLQRNIIITRNNEKLLCRLATSIEIEALGNGLYAIGNRKYYIKIEQASSNAFIKEGAHAKELIVPASATLTYSIIF